MNYINEYKKINASSKYLIYFIAYNKLCKLFVRDIPNNWIKKDKDGLRLYIPSKDKKAMFLQSKIVMSKVEFEQSLKEYNLQNNKNYNRGEFVELLTYENYKKEYKKDNIRFDKLGDIEVNDEQIQIKFENGHLPSYKTIEKLVK